MLQRFLARIGLTAALAAGGLMGLPAAANAQHRGAGGGHASVGHVSAGGAHVSRAYAAPRGAYANRAYVNRGAVGTNFRGAYGYARPGYGYYGSGYRYPGYRYGYGYRYPGYGLGLALGLGYPYYGNYGYGYGYPYYSGYYSDYGYPYVDSSTYVVPSYSNNVAAPSDTTSGYSPAEQAPPPLAANAARIIVQLPADAHLWLDGQPTQQAGPARIFETPAVLDPGRTYTYHVRAEWTQDGQPVVRERDVTFQAGGQVVVNMNVP